MSVSVSTTGKTFMLPDLGEGLTEAEIMEWHVAEGDEVKVDQIVVTVETAKATVDLPCPYAGRVLTLHGVVGAVLEVGKPLLTVGSHVAGADPVAVQGDPAGLAGAAQYREEEQAGSKAPATEMPATEMPATEEKSGSGNVLIGYGTSETKRSHRRRVTPGNARSSGLASDTAVPVAVAPVAVVPVVAAPTGEPTTTPKVISPVVRKLARDNGIDLTDLAATGAGHVICRADVEAALSAGHAALQSGEVTPVQGDVRADRAGDIRIPLRGVRKVIADKLTTSRREIPDATTWVDADATALMATKDEIKAVNAAAGIGVMALFARISVAGLKKFPELNARVDVEAQEIVQLSGINLSFAAQSPRGLVVPVIHGAGEMTTTELAAALRELTELARNGKLSPAQMTGGTFTLNNYGVFGVDGSTPIINYPEAAMLGVGRIIDRPWAHEGEVALRKVTQLGLTFDHRVCDGGTAGGFLRFVANCVERPASLFAEL